MLRNIKKVEEMFNAADQIIRDRPEILSLDVDTIFDELDDGTREMRSIRWGGNDSS